MKKVFTFISLLCLTIFLSACSNKSEISNENKLTSYQSITLEETIQKIQEKEDFYLYVGRPTCQYCVKFSPNLETAIQNTQVPVYYLNTDEEKTEEATAFVQKEGIQTVPNLAYYKAGQKVRYLIKGSESSLEEIEDFLKQE